MRVQDTGCRVDVRRGISTCENFGNDFVDVDGVLTVVVVFIILPCDEGGTEFWGGGHRRDVNFWDRLAAWTNDLKWGSRAWWNGEWSFVRRIPRGGVAPGTRGRIKENGFFVVRVIGRHSKNSSHGT